MALAALLDHPEVFDPAESVLRALADDGHGRARGLEEGAEAKVTAETLSAFERAASEVFEASLHGDYCKVTRTRTTARSC